jgi:ribosomal protein L25 (general stress protein Ctc)
MSRTYKNKSIYNKGWNNEDDGFKKRKKAFKKRESKRIRQAAKVNVVIVDHSAEITALRNKAQWLRDEAEKLRQKAAVLTAYADNLCKQNCIVVEDVVIKHNLDWEIF